jgi:3alpha(or 20beta)-hydroxysteroid dehydrogenase
VLNKCGSRHGGDSTSKEAIVDRLNGKVALITGAARGMGASHVERFIAEGARVVIGDVLDDAGQATAERLGDAVRFIHLDVTNQDDWAAAVALAETEFGGLDILVNNAGIVNWGPIGTFTLDQWNAIIGINLTGTFLGITAAAPALTARGGGSIVNISSTAGLKGVAQLPGYTAAKFGVRGLTKEAALDLGHLGIRVNSVHPGNIRTPMTDGLDVDQSQVALPRMGEPVELSNLVLFLASDESSFSTGAEFVADGGETAGIALRDR